MYKIIICEDNKCTGCYACVNVCPSKCITMQENKYGELHPLIDEKLCIGCKSCVKACPNNNQLQFKYPIKCLASWITDDKKRNICASGGIGTILSEFVIKYKRGIVYGTRYNEDMIPVTAETSILKDLEYFKGSKYVQSIVGEKIFKNIELNLKAGYFILYIATPCQIAGLKSFLKKDFYNLITVDLICHGVCPTRYFVDEISFIKEKYKIRSLTNVRFRGNDGNDFCLTLWSKRKLIYKRTGYYSYYLNGFLSGISLRENCYSCIYAQPKRISDITIGDFIGLGEKDKFDYNKNNISCVTINTNKGLAFYNEVTRNMSELRNIERDYNERLKYGPSLRFPFKRHKLNNIFKNNYLKYGYIKAIRKTLKTTMIKKQIIRIINTWTYIYRIPRKICRILLNEN
jgi:coenzyme F420-reducing hydrogenase beta subunit